MCQICKKIGYLGFRSSDLEQAIQPIKIHKILLMIDNCDKLIERGPEKLLHLLNEFITYTISLKIILITNKSDITELMAFEDSHIIQEMSLPPLSQQDAVRMMHLMCKHLSHFRSDYPTDRDLYKHKMFKEFFEFTPAQVMKMCTLIQRKVTLDEIYDDLMNERQADDLTAQPSMQKTESEMDNRLFSKI